MAAGRRLDELALTCGLPLPTWPGEWPRIDGVCHDSRRVTPGDLFVAIHGERFDGRRYAGDAVRRGASAVLGPAPENAREAEELGVPWVIADEPRQHLATLAREVYGATADRWLTVGITGTNGKSSVMTLLAAVLENAGHAPGRLGTVGYEFRDQTWQTEGRTTPEATDLYRMLAAMATAGADSAVMEVSSHALEMGRVEGLHYDLAVFTNLTRDHLDFHHDMESYYAAKRQLFDRLKAGGSAVVHLVEGDMWARRLADELRSTWAGGEHRLLTCGADDADVRLASCRLDLDGIDATLHTPAGQLNLRSPLIGRFHLQNLITTATAAIALGISLETIEKSLAAAETVPGRLEKVPGDIDALVDFAHTPGALEAALIATRELTVKPIVAVFGCGGEKDRGKRPEMGRIVGERADLPILTSDNPRREDPLSIIADAETGLRQSGCALYLVEPDRRTAIRQAVARARAGDFLVLVAGKGHEATQDLGDRVIEFDDRLELAAAMATHSDSAHLQEISCG